MFRLHTLLVASGLVLALAPAARAACGGAQLCNPGDDPCIVDAPCSLTAGGTFDLGGRALQIKRKLTFTGAATTTILAGSVSVQQDGILRAEVAAGVSAAGGTLVVQSSGPIGVDAGGTIDVSGGTAGGTLTLTAAGDVTLVGLVDGNGNATAGLGGHLTITSTGGNVAVSGSTVRAAGGPSARGGSIQLTATTGDVTLAAKIDAGRGDCGGAACSIVIGAGGSVTSTLPGEIDAGASGNGDGGYVGITAGTEIALVGPVHASGVGSLGAGGLVELTATGGDVTVGAADVLGDVGGAGGQLVVDAAGAATLNGTVSVRSLGGGAGGTVDVTAGTTASLAGGIDARGTASGGHVSATAVGALTAAGAIDASGAGATVLLEGCSVSLPVGGLVTATGGGVTLRAGNAMAVAGTITAGTGVTLSHRTPVVPVVTGTVAPAPAIGQDESIPCCTDVDADGACDYQDLCPGLADPAQLDQDADGVGDACDACTGGPTLLKPQLKYGRFDTPAGDDRLIVKGSIPLASPPLLHPDIQGLRLILRDGAGGDVLDVTVPPGVYDALTRVGWRGNTTGTSWTWQGPMVGGAVTKAKLKRKSTAIDVQLQGTRGTFATSEPARPLDAVVVLTPPVADAQHCGQATFTNGPASPYCRVAGGGLVCK